VAPARLARELAALRRAIREADPDVAVVVTAYLPVALLAARLERVPTVLYAAEILDGRRRVLARTAGLATGIVAPSELVAARLPGAAEIVPPGIDPRPQPPVELPGTAPRIAVVGALSRARGQDVAVDALPHVRAAIPGASLLVVGEAHARPADESFAGGLRGRAGEGAHFLGPVPDVWPLLAAVDAVVVPNRVEEGFGRVAFEAVAVGTPAVTTPLTAAARLLPEPRLPVVPPERPDLLARAVLELLRDPGRATAATAGARAWVSEHLDEAELGGRFVEVVHAVAASGNDP
jgi:glycosyltransferase involved in cell wall biosynthesis